MGRWGIYILPNFEPHVVGGRGLRHQDHGSSGFGGGAPYSCDRALNNIDPSSREPLTKCGPSDGDKAPLRNCDPPITEPQLKMRMFLVCCTVPLTNRGSTAPLTEFDALVLQRH